MAYVDSFVRASPGGACLPPPAPCGRTRGSSDAGSPTAATPAPPPGCTLRTPGGAPPGTGRSTADPRRPSTPARIRPRRPPQHACPLPSRDRSPLQECPPSPRAIGPRYRNIPPPLAR
eukprot:9472702-Pyramimonas_sp.AAC.1